VTHRPAAARLAITALAAAWLFAASAATEAPPAWSALSRAQQEVLAPLRQDWATIDADRKQKWLEVARRFPTMPVAERQRIQERMAEWARLTPAERGRARLQFQQSRVLSPEDRQAAWEQYKALPDDQREALARSARPAPQKPAEPPRGNDVTAKRNIVPASRPPAVVKPVAPTVVQANPGATTSLINTRPAAPSHQQPGLPKIAATQGFVDPNTLLPRRGPQGAGVAAPPPKADAPK
jgi:hypothetical protein